MNSAKTPKPPNAGNVIKQQTSANKAAATGTQAINEVGQVTPYGSLTYTPGPGGTSTATTTLSPGNQALLSGQQATAGAANTAALSDIATNKPLDLSNPSVMNAITQTYTPQFQQNQQWAQEQLNSQLASQGITPGSEAYDRAQQNFQTSQSNAWNNILESAYGQQVQSLEGQSQIPINEAATLSQMGAPQGIGLITTPQTSIQPTNTAGIQQQTYQDQLQRQQLAQQQQNAMMGGLFGLGGAAIQGYGTYAGDAALGAALA